MRRKKALDIDPLIDEDEDDLTSQFSEFELTELERENLKSLLEDVELDITEPFYELICKKLIFYLEHGYKGPEVQGELSLSFQEMMQFRNKCPQDFWEKHSIASTKWLGRKRASLLKNPSPSDLNIVQTLDPLWSPKKININITPQDTALSQEEKERVKKLFPSETKAIDVEVVEKASFKVEKVSKDGKMIEGHFVSESDEDK